MQCRKVKKLLEAYLEGELDKSRSGAMESHIASCHKCIQEMELALKVHKSVVGLSTPPIPEDIIPNTLERIHGKPATRWSWLQVFGGVLGERWPVVVSAVILVGLIAFGIGYERFSSKPDLTEAEIASAEEGIKLALGIVAAGTQYAQNTALEEGTRAYDLVKVASVDTIRKISETQSKVSEKIRTNLDFLSQLNFEEVKNNEEF